MAKFVFPMKKRRIIADPLLMLVTILVITGFQVYWLKNNYDREKRSLEIRTNVHFQETVVPADWSVKRTVPPVQTEVTLPANCGDGAVGQGKSIVAEEPV